jgi:predicted amidohydrolase YtcJ
MAQLAITNGMIWDGEQPPFLGTVLCRDKIKKVIPGPTPSLPPDVTVLDARGGSVLPAFTDCHFHFSSFARTPLFLILSGCKSLQEVVSLVEERSRSVPPDSLIIASRFNHNNWADPIMPTRADIDHVPNPVVLRHICGHAHVVNSRVLSIIGESAFDGLDGAVRDADGRLTGVLNDAAHDPVRLWAGNLPNRADDWLVCMDRALEVGIAEVHAIDPAVMNQDEPIDVYQELLERGKLSVRVRLYYAELPVLPIMVRSGFGNDWIAYGGHKIFLDGALGSRTAAMREPYEDSGGTGILRFTEEELYNTVKRDFLRGRQLMAHVIGDGGLDQILNVLERLHNEKIVSGWPVKLTHVQICRPDQVERIARLGVYCDMQPYHLLSDARYLPSAIGQERFDCCIPLASLFRAGVVVSGGSDAPVEPYDPLTGLHAAVVRGGFNDAERISLHDALKLYTINAQKVIKNDHRKGLLKRGHLADIVVFAEDLFAVAPEDLRSCKVAATVVNGKVAYRRPQ